MAKLDLSLSISMFHCLQVSMYINSPGGVVTAGLAIYDTMQVSGSSSTAMLPCT